MTKKNILKSLEKVSKHNYVLSCTSNIDTKELLVDIVKITTKEIHF